MPHTIAIIGAGPVGIEAALQAELRGHRAILLEAGPEAASSIAAWGHVRLFTPWRMNTSKLGRARLGDPPELSGEDFPTGAELRERYLLPLAASLDLRPGRRVRRVGRHHLGKGDQLGSTARSAEPFRLLIDGPEGEELVDAQVVIDCSGTWGDPAPCGPGGMEVRGERELRARSLVRHGPVAVADLAGARVLLIGDGASAITQLQALLDLEPAASISWLTPTERGPGFSSPTRDPLPGRAALYEAGRAARTRVDFRPGAWVSRFEVNHEEVKVFLEDGDWLEVDQVLCCTGFRPDHHLTRELQVHVCWGTEGPMKLAAHLLATRGGGGGDCLAAPSPGDAEILRAPEPGFFVLGAKSFGRRSDFLMETGFEQVGEVMRLLFEA